jgi:hypothetical protein
MLKRRADLFKMRAPHYRILLRVVQLLAPTEKMNRDIKDLRKEKDFGRMSVFEHLVAAGIYPFGKGHEIRTNYFGNAIQPKTVVTEYNQ